MGTGRLYDLYVPSTDVYGNAILNKINNGTVVKTLTFNGYTPNISAILRKSTGELYVAGTNSVSNERHIYKFVNDIYSLRIDCKFGAAYETAGDGPHCLAEDKNGIIWIGGTNYIYKLENDIITKAISLDNLGVDSVQQIVCARKTNTVIIRAMHSICKISNDSLSADIYTDVSTFLENIGIDKNDNLYCVCNSGTDTSNVRIFSPNLTFLKNLPFYVYRYGKFFMDKQLNSYLVDYRSIYRIDTDGNQLEKYNHYGLTQYGAYNPGNSGVLCGDIILDKDNNLYYWTIKISLNTKTSELSGSAAVRTQGDVTGMQWEIKYNSKFNLIQEGTTIKTFNGTSFTTIGSAPVTDTMFQNNGFTDFTGLTKDKLSSLSSPKILTKKADSTTSNIKVTGTPLGKLILAANDITFSDTVSNIDKFTLSSTNSGTGIMKIITSFDSGTTWKHYNTANSAWETVDKNNLAEVEALGNAVSEFNALGNSVWDSAILSAGKKVRFGYYLEANATTDVVETDLLTMQVDMNGSWVLCKVGTDFTYSYMDTENMKVNLISNGDFRITIV